MSKKCIIAASNRACSDRSGLKEAMRDPMKFRNGDVSLDEAILRNNGEVVMVDAGVFVGESW